VEVIDDRASQSGDLARTGLREQLATGALERERTSARKPLWRFFGLRLRPPIAPIWPPPPLCLR
jgi:hypothetical protein